MKGGLEPSWEWHCVDQAARHYRAETGKSLWAKAGVKAPRSAKQAAAVYRALNVRSLKGALTKVLGAPVEPRSAMRGDFVMVEGVGGAAAIGICRGEWVECIDRMQPLSRALCAWRVSRYRSGAGPAGQPVRASDAGPASQPVAG